MLSRSRHSGFTLVEVMVTVFIVAIGLLAAAGLQAVSKKAALDAMQRTTASVLAQDMLERIRANPGEVGRYASQGRELNTAPTTTVSCGGTSNCSAAELVDYDLMIWWQSLDGAAEKITNGTAATSNAGGLRSPVGCIRFNANRMVEVVVAWRGLSQIEQALTTETADPTSDACGRSLADYEVTGNNSFRRVLRLQGHVQVLS